MTRSATVVNASGEGLFLSLHSRRREDETPTRSGTRAAAQVSQSGQSCRILVHGTGTGLKGRGRNRIVFKLWSVSSLRAQPFLQDVVAVMGRCVANLPCPALIFFFFPQKNLGLQLVVRLKSLSYRFSMAKQSKNGLNINMLLIN